jgi:hypothetical protein
MLLKKPFVICLAAALAIAFVFVSSCTDDDGGSVAEEPRRIDVDVTYPSGAVTDGYRPSVAVYRAEDYDDFSQRPTAMPIAALVGQEAEESISGFITDLSQSEPYLFEPGDYSVVAGVAEASGMPSHVEGTPWAAVRVTIGTQDTQVVLTPDAHWSQ